jgi:hypothetical protein
LKRPPISRPKSRIACIVAMIANRCWARPPHHTAKHTRHNQCTSDGDQGKAPIPPNPLMGVSGFSGKPENTLTPRAGESRKERVEMRLSPSYANDATMQNRLSGGLLSTLSSPSAAKAYHNPC